MYNNQMNIRPQPQPQAWNSNDNDNAKTRRTAITIVKYVVLCLLVLIYLLPLLWMVSVSLMTNEEVVAKPFELAEKFQWENYSVAWEAANLGRATLNSAFVCGIALVVSLFLGSLAAFAIGRMRIKYLTKIFLIYFMIGMMVPIHCVLTPLFTSFADLDLTDSLWALILPYTTFGLPMTVFIMTNFFKGMSGEMFEAACIDGCNIYQCFFTIAFPLARNGLFVTGLMTFVGNWNEMLMALVFINDDEMKTLPLQLTSFVGPYSTNYGPMFAAIVIAVLPTIIVYCMFSNRIVDGLTQGAVKG